MPLRRIKSHKFGDKKYKIRWVRPDPDTDGQCHPPTNRPVERLLEIDPNLKTKRLMEVLIHEGLHAGCWVLDEPAVTAIAEDIANLLWKCGVRLDKNKIKKN